MKYVDVQLPHSIGEIAAKLNRKPRFVAWSLRRLEKRGKVLRAIDGWYARD
jgi:predicted transcriptional regulator